MLNARRVRCGRTVTVQLVGQLVRAHAEPIAAVFAAVVSDVSHSDTAIRVVVVDFDLVDRVDAAGVSLLCGLRQQLAGSRAELLVARVQRAVRSTFKTYAVDSLFVFEPALS